MAQPRRSTPAPTPAMPTRRRGKVSGSGIEAVPAGRSSLQRCRPTAGAGLDRTAEPESRGRRCDETGRQAQPAAPHRCDDQGRAARRIPEPTAGRDRASRRHQRRRGRRVGAGARRTGQPRQLQDPEAVDGCSARSTSPPRMAGSSAWHFLPAAITSCGGPPPASSAAGRGAARRASPSDWRATTMPTARPGVRSRPARSPTTVTSPPATSTAQCCTSRPEPAGARRRRSQADPRHRPHRPPRLPLPVGDQGRAHRSTGGAATAGRAG